MHLCAFTTTYYYGGVAGEHTKNYVLYQPDSFLEVIKSLLIIPLAFQGMTHVVVQLRVPLVHTKSGHED